MMKWKNEVLPVTVGTAPVSDVEGDAALLDTEVPSPATEPPVATISSDTQVSQRWQVDGCRCSLWSHRLSMAAKV